MTDMTRRKYQSIVLADDDSDDRDLFDEAVCEIDDTIQITMVKDGEELMDLLSNWNPERGKPDLIFLDLNMPRKNGKECLIEIQHNAALLDIPVIIYTTSLNPIDVDEMFTQGARRFFRKPNSFAELKQGIYNILASDLAAGNNREKAGFILNMDPKTEIK